MMVDGSRYHRMLHNGYNTTCPHNTGRELQYGYNMEAGHILKPKDSNMRPNPRRKELNDGQQVDGSRYNGMLHYGYNTNCPNNIGGEGGNEGRQVYGSRYNRMLHYRHKVIELGTHVVQRTGI